MSPTLKRILLLAALLAAAALIGFGLYYLFKRTQPVAPPVPQPPLTPGVLPPSGERPIPTVPEAPATPGLPGAPGTRAPAPEPTYFRGTPVAQVTNDFAAFPSVSSNGSIRYHNLADGKFYRIMDGKARELVDQVFFNVQKVTWAKSRDKAVLEYPDGNKLLYNFELKRQITLPKHWENFTFSPDSNEIAAKSLGLAPENRWLVVSKDDGSGTQLIEPLGENANRVTMNWSPSRQTVALSQTGQPVGGDRREVLFIGLRGENFKSTVVEGLDFQPQWSPTGKKLLYSVDSARSDFKPELWIVNSFGDDIGSNRQMLGLYTWANKCAFAGDETLYCAVPRDLPRGAGMEPSIADSSYDDLVKVDVRTGLKTPISLGSDYRINSVQYDTAGNKLFFTDRTQTGVFEVRL